MPCAPLKSKRGCRTCLIRRKKCDEGRPICEACQRLQLNCVPRTTVTKQGRSGSVSTLSMLSLRASQPPPLPVYHGHPPFKTQAELILSLRCPAVVRSFLSPTAGKQFEDLTFLASAATADTLVRKAAVAFVSAFKPIEGVNNKEVCLTNYQSSIYDIRHYLLNSTNSHEPIHVILCVTLLGILERLYFGSFVSMAVLFGICGNLLRRELQQRNWSSDPMSTKLYRIASECVISNSATLGLFLPKEFATCCRWDDILDELFPDGETRYAGSSPFLGGFHRIYRLMLRITSMFQNQYLADSLEQEVLSINSELDNLDREIPLYYDQSETDKAAIRLYEGKHRLHLLALRSLLELVSRPESELDECRLGDYMEQTIRLLASEDLKESNNPAISWPITVLLCTATKQDDFEFLLSNADEFHSVLDPASKIIWTETRSQLMNMRQSQETCKDGRYKTLLDHLIYLNRIRSKT